MPVLLGRRTLGGWLPSGPAGNYLVHPEQHQRPEHDLLRAKQDQAASQLFFDGLEGLEDRFATESASSPSGVTHVTFTRR